MQFRRHRRQDHTKFVGKELPDQELLSDYSGVQTDKKTRAEWGRGQKRAKDWVGRISAAEAEAGVKKTMLDVLESRVHTPWEGLGASEQSVWERLLRTADVDDSHEETDVRAEAVLPADGRVPEAVLDQLALEDLVPNGGEPDEAHTEEEGIERPSKEVGGSGSDDATKEGGARKRAAVQNKVEAPGQGLIYINALLRQLNLRQRPDSNRLHRVRQGASSVGDPASRDVLGPGDEVGVLVKVPECGEVACTHVEKHPSRLAWDLARVQLIHNAAWKKS